MTQVPVGTVSFRSMGSATYGDASGIRSAYGFRLLIACAWLLMLCTFSFEGRDQDVHMGAMDSLALMKVCVRGLVFLGLMGLVARN